jgi:hypothetical protein
MRDERDGRDVIELCTNREILFPVSASRPILSLAFHEICSSIKNVLCLVYVLSAFGCAHLKPLLTSAELRERLQYCHDSSLEELVGIALFKGYPTVSGDGQARQVLELNNPQSATIHRQFFQVQPYGDGLSEVFFLENRGSIKHSKLKGFPRHARKAVSDFLDGLPKDKRSEYKPLLIRQEKMSRRMIFYETAGGKKAFEFTRKVTALEISSIYGLYPLPDGPFIFLVHERKKLSREDFLRADARYQDLVNTFLSVFRGEIKL